MVEVTLEPDVVPGNVEVVVEVSGLNASADGIPDGATVGLTSAGLRASSGATPGTVDVAVRVSEPNTSDEGTPEGETRKLIVSEPKDSEESTPDGVTTGYTLIVAVTLEPDVVPASVLLPDSVSAPNASLECTPGNVFVFTDVMVAAPRTSELLMPEGVTLGATLAGDDRPPEGIPCGETLKSFLTEIGT